MKNKIAGVTAPVYTNTLGVISLYPKKNELYSTGTSGIASFAKNIVRHLPSKAVVFADYQSKPQEYTEGNTTVVRCFRQNSPFMWLNIVQNLNRFPSIRTVLIEFDFALYGSIFTSGLILPFIMLLKMLGYSVYVQSHSVVTNVFTLSGHLGIKENFIGKLKGHIMNTVFHFFYWIIGWCATGIILAEEALRTELAELVPAEKITVIPHGVDTELTRVSKKTARKILGIKPDENVVLFFGFMNWFKGADFFANAFKKTKTLLGKDARFIIAGGESATLKSKSHYREFYEQTLTTVQEAENISITGFVPQSDISLYFAACDLVVFPYRTFFSASGVLSLAMTYQKPFIVSKPISKLFTASDMKEPLKHAQLNVKDVTFALTDRACIETSKKVLRNGLKKKMVHFTGEMRRARDWNSIALKYKSLLLSPQYAGILKTGLAIYEK